MIRGGYFYLQLRILRRKTLTCKEDTQLRGTSKCSCTLSTIWGIFLTTTPVRSSRNRQSNEGYKTQYSSNQFALPARDKKVLLYPRPSLSMKEKPGCSSEHRNSVRTGANHPHSHWCFSTFSFYIETGRLAGSVRSSARPEKLRS